MSATIVSADGSRARTVKNLGWILRHWQDVEQLQWLDLDDSTRAKLGVHPITDGLFIAHLRDGGVYSTPYASFDVWLGFIDRSVFHGLKTTITRNGHTADYTVCKRMAEAFATACKGVSL